MKDQSELKSDIVNQSRSVSVVEMILNLFSRWRMIFLLAAILSIVISAIVAFLITPKFKSTASVFPAEKADLLGGLEGITSLAKSFSPSKALSSLGSNPETDRYLAILKSGTVISAVIRKFDLVHVYDITSYPGENTAKELLDNVDFTVETEGNITITVYDKDPKRAADMANYFVEMLNKKNTELQVQNARGNRQFIEERYNKNLSDLAASEDSLKAFQKKYGVIAMPEQTEASIKAAAEITGQLVIKEVQGEVFRRTQSSDNPSVIATQIEIDELHKKLSQMNSGVNVSTKEMNVFVPFSKIPDLGGEYIRKLREVEIQYKILQFITPLYEQAKVEEQRSTPSVIVLDYASPAERKAKPKRLFIILAGALIGVFGTFLYTALYERLSNEKKNDTALYQSLLSLSLAVQNDIRSFYKKFR
jgi:uncharacterized protein involved in exopolysaccharide biosynthesis